MQELSDSLLKILLDSPYAKCATNISISCKDNTLIIKGHVASYYQKQMIQEVLKKPIEGKNVCLKNEIFVQYDGCD